MDLVALEAVGQRQSFGVRFVTGEAGRFEPVRSMAGRTGKLCVFARKGDKLLTDGAVTVVAGINKHGRNGDFLRCVWIGMTCYAFGDFGSVRCFMT